MWKNSVVAYNNIHLHTTTDLRWIFRPGIWTKDHPNA